jgi:hypothetical protein
MLSAALCSADASLMPPRIASSTSVEVDMIACIKPIDVALGICQPTLLFEPCSQGSAPFDPLSDAESRAALRAYRETLWFNPWW